jgi:hypothetical protein
MSETMGGRCGDFKKAATGGAGEARWITGQELRGEPVSRKEQERINCESLDSIRCCGVHGYILGLILK